MTQIPRGNFPRRGKPGIIGLMDEVFLITKRHLGLLFMAAGALTVGGVLIYDLLKHHAIGERLQLVALAGAVLMGLLGATLLPLGDQAV